MKNGIIIPFAVLNICILLGVQQMGIDDSMTQETFADQSDRLGYPRQNFEVQAEDGYLTSISRIQKKGTKIKEGLQPVLILLGVGNSVDNFAAGYENTSLAYMIANQNKDVFIYDPRGNRYSQGHVRLNSEQDSEYWSFSWEQMGSQDLPAIMAYLASKTKQKIDVMGFSQGCAMVVASLSEKNEIVKNNTRQVLLLGPAVYVAGNNSLFISLGRYLLALYVKLGILQFNDPVRGLYYLTKYLHASVARFTFEIISDKDLSFLEEDRLLNFMGNYPAGTSIRVYEHWAQLTEEHGFRKYDYGEETNQIKYGQKTPPEYYVSNITTPVHIFAGKHDAFASIDNSHKFRDDLVNSENVTFHEYDGGHMYFMIPKDITVYKDVLNVLND